MRKFFTLKRVVAIVLIVLFVVIISLLPNLNPNQTNRPINIDGWSLMCVGFPISLAYLGFRLANSQRIKKVWEERKVKEAERQARIEAQKASWRALDLDTVVEYWSVAPNAESKTFLASTTIGKLLIINPDGYRVDLPANLQPEDGLVIVRFRQRKGEYEHIRLEIYTKKYFAVRFPMFIKQYRGSFWDSFEPDGELTQYCKNIGPAPAINEVLTSMEAQ